VRLGLVRVVCAVCVRAPALVRATQACASLLKLDPLRGVNAHCFKERSHMPVQNSSEVQA